MTTETVAVAKPAKLAKVKLTGVDGNAFMLLGVCRKAARNAKYSNEQIEAFLAEAMAGDYDHLLVTCCEWFEVR